MRITLFLASSLNGMIARPDQREDFLSRDHWEGFLECAKRTGGVIWGRRTHERVNVFNKHYLDRMWELEKIVVTRKKDFDPGSGFDLATSPEDAVKKLEANGCTGATLAGGSVLNSAFAKAQLIDEVILNVEAVIIGSGIPLFSDETFDLKLEDNPEVRRLTDRIVQLHYGVAKS